MSDQHISVPRVPWHESEEERIEEDVGPDVGYRDLGCAECRGEGDIWVEDVHGTRSLIYCPLCASRGLVPTSTARQVYFLTTGEEYPGPQPAR